MSDHWVDRGEAGPGFGEIPFTPALQPKDITDTTKVDILSEILTKLTNTGLSPEQAAQAIDTEYMN